ncbi:TonB-dependent receptor [Chitinophaga cymbidii]|nr:TonB-dependent receptor [Chitinophaga cymbidii]
MKGTLQKYCWLMVLLLASWQYALAQNQTTITGTVTDAATRQNMAGVSISVKGASAGAVTDASGSFRLNTNHSLPLTLVFSYVGYSPQEVRVTDASMNVNVQLSSTEILGQEVVVSASRVPETILESPVSIEKLNVRAIKETPTPSFYDFITNFKGVESSSQSLTFRSITTRGFNANGNTRFNQFIDGMDNQAPGLNFSVGNILGITELDVENVELLPGAASALYGAGGTNGTLLMTSKNPYDYQGLSLQLKGAVNHLGGVQRSSAGFIPEITARYAKAFGKFAFKVNVAYLQANDWQALDSTNFDRIGLVNKSGHSHLDDPAYDGINIYGDEINNRFTATGGLLNGVTVSRTGYRERDVVDYDTRSLKTNAALHYRFNPNAELILHGNWGQGTTVYTGLDRYSLRNFNMGQYKIELKGQHYFVRAYTTQERSGEAYNSTAMASFINEAYNPSAITNGAGQVIGGWFAEYATVYNLARAGTFPGSPGAKDSVTAHAIARAYADRDRLQPGTASFERVKDSIGSRYIGVGAGRGGAKFDDKTNLYHYEAMYNFSHLVKFFDLQAGASFRRYDLNSNGTIFDDASRDIKIDEYAGFLQVGKKLANDRIKLTGSLRYDKNENFEGRFTPRFTGVFTVAKNNNIRLSYQTGFRIPTTQNQYIDLEVRSKTRIIGGLPELVNKYNLNTNKGYTQASFQKFRQTLNPADLEQYTFGELKPERVQAYEIGYRGLIKNRLLIDAYYYYNSYRDFVTIFAIVQSPDGTPAGLANPNIFSSVYNNDERVVTQGWALGLDYVVNHWNLSGNVSFNEMTKEPVGLYNDFNTPKFRFNLGVGNRNVYKNLGFNISYRWQDEFYWRSSFVSGMVPAFSTLDAMISYQVPKAHATIKLGGSNLLNKYYVTSLGNPSIGGIYYLSLTFEDLLK